MKKWLIITILLFTCGCSFDLMTEDNPLGAKDPNQFAAFFEAGLKAAGATQAVGTATGNPAAYGIGALGTAVLMLLGGSYLKGKKK